MKLIGPERQTETATLFGDLSGDWELSFEHAGATVTVSAGDITHLRQA